MKNIYVLKYKSNNIGDDIQTIAVTDILDKMNVEYKYIYRDHINNFDFNSDDDNYIIFNGWFTNGYGIDEYYAGYAKDNIILWPPKGHFKPIFYSFHISEWGPPGDREINYKLVDEESVRFYKSFATFGCRDEHTLNVMKKLGVDCYNSKCITLSLNKNLYINNINKNVLFVDVPAEHDGILNEATKSYYGDITIKRLTNHTVLTDFNDRLFLAKEHLMNFSSAELVITTRLHVLLPCLAFGTPVIFLVDDNDKNNSRLVDYYDISNVVMYSEISDMKIKDLLSSKYDRKLSLDIENKLKEIIINL